MKFGSLFTGFGGADIGAMAAGLKPTWGIECDARIAEIARTNLGNHIQMANILDCDPHEFEYVDVMHASPPCPNFSTAKKGGAETSNDLAMAAKIAEFVTVIQPRTFTLENVMGYRWSRSWTLIEDALHRAGYWINVSIINAADAGVPQARKRMIARAIHGGFVPYLPQALPHPGWYSAVQDIIDEFPNTNLAPWQVRSMPKNVDANLLVVGRGMSKERIAWRDDESAPTITAGVLSKTPMRAVLLGNNRGGRDRGVINHAYGNDPAFTITATNSTYIKSLGGGRIVAFTPRGVARLMSFPDWYELPSSKSLAGRGLGNAVPPSLYQWVIAGLFNHESMMGA